MTHSRSIRSGVSLLVSLALAAVTPVLPGQGGFLDRVKQKVEQGQKKIDDKVKGRQGQPAPSSQPAPPATHQAATTPQPTSPSPIPGAPAGSAAVDFASSPEPDHTALYKLFLAANADVLVLDPEHDLAWDNHFVLHTPPFGTPECAALGNQARNEITRQNLANQFRQEILRDLEQAKSWPRTARFRMRGPLALGAYDMAKGSFPVQAGGMIAPGGRAVYGIARSMSDLSPVTYYGPAKSFCSSNGPRTLKSFALSLQGAEKIQQLPIASAEAERLLNEIGGNYRVNIELLVDVGPNIPIKDAPVDARVVAARVLNPKTGNVLYNYDGFLAPATEPGTPATGSATVPLTTYAAALLVIRDAPHVLTPDTLIKATTEQIWVEQNTWKIIAASLPAANTGPRGMHGPGPRGSANMRNPNPKRPAFVYEWQKYVESNSPLGRKELLEVFVRPDADWSFVKREPEWDDRFQAIVDAVVFSRDKVESRDAQFAAQELAPVYRQYLQAVAKAVSSRFEIEVPLMPPNYDFTANAFRFEVSGQVRGSQPASSSPLELLSPLPAGWFHTQPPPANSRETVAVLRSPAPGTVFYGLAVPGRGWRLPDPPTVKPGVGLDSATKHWRDRIVTSSALPYVMTIGLDRRLAISAIPVDRARAESLVRTIQTQGGEWHARVFLEQAHGDFGDSYSPSSPPSRFGVVYAKVGRIEFYGPGNVLVSSLGAGSTLASSSTSIAPESQPARPTAPVPDSAPAPGRRIPNTRR